MEMGKDNLLCGVMMLLCVFILFKYVKVIIYFRVLLCLLIILDGCNVCFILFYKIIFLCRCFLVLLYNFYGGENIV